MRARIVTYTLLLLWLCDYFIVQPAKITVEELPPPEPGLTSLTQRLQDHVHFLASEKLQGRAPGTPGNSAAAKYLLDQFEKIGLVSPTPTGQRTQSLPKNLGKNIFSALPRPQPGRGWILIGAHFDHLGRMDGKDYPGADDNASGAAILLETARRLVQSGPLREYNLLFVGFNTEESPYFLTYLMGSHQFYQKLAVTGIDPKTLRLAIIMDIMGGIFWEPMADTLFVMGAEKSPGLGPLVRSTTVSRLNIRTLGMAMIENVPSTGGMIFSDYQVFRAHNIPFLFLSSGRTPDYHRPTDTPEKLNYPRMARTVHWLSRLIQQLDRHPGRWVYQRRRETLEEDYRAIAPYIRLASQWINRIPQTGWITLYRLKQDQERMESIQAKIQLGQKLGPNDARALQHASIRIQCLLGQMGPCFLLP